MAKEVKKTGCPLNCVDGCQWLVTVENGRVTGIKGGTDNPLTKGFVCSKAQKQLERMESIDRITTPMYRKDKLADNWQSISWDDAFNVMAEQLERIKKEYGTTAVYHHYDYGSNGILRTLDQRFFNAYGGVSGYTGSVCWASGYRAQEYDFGEVACSDWSDLANAKTIILWGRDPAVTSIHMVPFIKEARDRGGEVIVINPLKVKSTAFSDKAISPRPGTDGALALGISHYILANRWLDLNFVQENVIGFDRYAQMVKEYPLDKVSSITGLKVEDIKYLAEKIARDRPASIIIGYGLQRYANGGNTVRAIDSLAAITGNIGKPGAGAHYAQGVNSKLLKKLSGVELAANKRSFPVSRVGEELLSATEPPVKAIFVTRSNPVAQLPDTTKVKEAFNRTDFVVVIDYHLNDTALTANLILPCTTIFEDMDLISTCWNNYLTLAESLVPRRGQAKPDWEIFSKLASKMGLESFQVRKPEAWLEHALSSEAAVKAGITLAKLREGSLRNPLSPQVAWSELKFSTSSGKFELYSELAAQETGCGLGEFKKPAESLDEVLQEDFPYHFITPHPEQRMHSQFINLEEDSFNNTWPTVEIHPETATKHYLRNLDQVMVESPRGQVQGVAKLTSRVRPDTIVMEEGRWMKEGGGVNFLTSARIADMGHGTPYYDCLCNLRKISE